MEDLELFKREFLPLFTQLCDDKVVNVRISAAKVLAGHFERKTAASKDIDIIKLYAKLSKDSSPDIIKIVNREHTFLEDGYSSGSSEHIRSRTSSAISENQMQSDDKAQHAPEDLKTQIEEPKSPEKEVVEPEIPEAESQNKEEKPVEPVPESEPVTEPKPESEPVTEPVTEPTSESVDQQVAETPADTPAETASEAPKPEPAEPSQAAAPQEPSEQPEPQTDGKQDIADNKSD